MRRIGIPGTLGTEPPERCCVVITREYGNRAHPKFPMYCVAPWKFPDWQRARQWNISAKRILGCLHMSMQEGKQIPFTSISRPTLSSITLNLGLPLPQLVF